MSSLLVQSDGVLSGGLTVRSESLRGACWLARAALEDVVAEYLRVAGYDVGEASMAAKLACLESATLVSAPGVSAAARFAWLGLSQASHHHAYELTPTVSEVKHLLGLVSTVVAAAEALRPAV